MRGTVLGSRERRSKAVLDGVGAGVLDRSADALPLIVRL